MPYEEHIRAAAGEMARCAVLTLSDTRDSSTDSSGQKIQAMLRAAGHEIAEYQVLRDDPEQLAASFTKLLDRKDIDAIVTNGGTGIGRRDCTIDVVEARLDQRLPGFGELFRMLSFEQIGSGAMLSRAVAGIATGKIVFCLPGSTKAVELAMSRLILPELKHLVHEVSK